MDDLRQRRRELKERKQELQASQISDMPYYQSNVGFMNSNPASLQNSNVTSPFNPKYLDRGIMDSVTPG
jgi:hypothetical protein